jgi:hypothetical protein
MGLNNKGWIVLDSRSPLTKIATTENLPCCTLCAMWCLDVADDVKETSVSRYAGQDTDWWKQANVYEWTEPWSALVAIQEKLGGTIAYCAEVEDFAPPLTPGHWHVIQRWGKLGLNDEDLMEDDEVVNGSYGHTYLAYADEKEEGKVTIIQSSIKKGYRTNVGTWQGNAGLKGFSVGVLTLPA